MRARLFQWLHLPGFIRPFRFQDPVTGQVVAVRTSPRYTVLSVGGKELFFLRENGRFDGTGALAIDDPAALNGCMVERLEHDATPQS